MYEVRRQPSGVVLYVGLTWSIGFSMELWDRLLAPVKILAETGVATESSVTMNSDVVLLSMKEGRVLIKRRGHVDHIFSVAELLKASGYEATRKVSKSELLFSSG